MADTLVLGLGNILLGDEGVGVRVVERLLERYDFPEGVRVMDGGTLGLDLLPYVEDASRLLVVDAVQARKPPGTLVRMTGDEIPVFLDASKVSPHQEGLQDLLAVVLPEHCVAERCAEPLQDGRLAQKLSHALCLAAHDFI